MRSIFLTILAFGYAAAVNVYPPERHLLEVCGPGTYLNGTDCTLCSDSTYKAGDGDEEELCLPCPDHDAQATADATSCECLTSSTFFVPADDGGTCVSGYLSIETEPASAISGENLGVEPVIHLVDASSELVAGVEVTIEAELLREGTAVAGSMYSADLVDGVATFTSVEMPTYPGDGFVLRFWASGDSEVYVDSNAFQIWTSGAIPACSDGVLDAGGECCDGSLDDCGVCDGDGETCSLAVHMDIVDEATFDADSYADSLCADVEGAVGLESGRCVATSTAESTQIRFEVTPPQGYEMTISATKQALFTQALDDSSALYNGTTVTQYVDSSVAPTFYRQGVCENGFCEVGETHDTCDLDCERENADPEDVDDDDTDHTILYLILFPISGLTLLYCIAMRTCMHKRVKKKLDEREGAAGVLMRINHPRFRETTHGEQGSVRNAPRI